MHYKRSNPKWNNKHFSNPSIIVPVQTENFVFTLKVDGILNVLKSPLYTGSLFIKYRSEFINSF